MSWQTCNRAAPLLLALVVVTGIGERFWPAESRPLLARGHVQDACYLALLVIPFMTLLSVGAASLIADHARWIALRPAGHWPGWLLVPLTLAGMDGANWLAHYADHRLDSLMPTRAMAGRAVFPSRRDGVGRTGLDGRPVPVEQDASRGPAPLLIAGQLIEPFRSRG